MSDDTKNPFRKPHFLIGAAILSAFGAAIGGFLFTSGQSLVEDAMEGPPLTARVLLASEFQTDRNPVTSTLVPLDGPTPAELGADSVEGANWYRTTWDWSDVATLTHDIRLELRTTLPQQVLIESITPRILTRTEPTTGWYIADGGCGMMMLRLGRINLDDPAPVLRMVNPFEEDTPSQIFVTDSDTEVLQIYATTRKHYVEWVLELAYSAPDGRGTITIDNNGEPFRLTSGIGSQVYVPDWETKDFKRRPDWDNGIVMC